MAQRLHVVSCVGCNIFQVQIVKKSSNKWTCKVCNTKQSVLRVFAEGSGKDCRLVAQKLNSARGERQEEKEQIEERVEEQGSEEEFDEPLVSNTNNNNKPHSSGGVNLVPQSHSKWAKYVEDSTTSDFLFD